LRRQRLRKATATARFGVLLAMMILGPALTRFSRFGGQCSCHDIPFPVETGYLPSGIVSKLRQSLILLVLDTDVGWSIAIRLARNLFPPLRSAVHQARAVRPGRVVSA